MPASIARTYYFRVQVLESGRNRFDFHLNHFLAVRHGEGD